jgi:hypothetical protein
MIYSSFFIHPSENNRIVLDVDGVLLDFLENFERVFEHELKRKPKRVNESFDLAVAYEMSRAEVRRVWDRFDLSDYHGDYQPMHDGYSIEGANLMKEMGYDLWLVTAVPSNIQAIRHNNLKNHGLDLNVDQVVCVGIGGSKRDALAEIKPGLIVDDRLNHLIEAHPDCTAVWIENDIEQEHHLVPDGFHYLSYSNLLELAIDIRDCFGLPGRPDIPPQSLV